MVHIKFPETILAPDVFLPSQSELNVFGVRWVDSHGQLSNEGLCAFWTLASMVLCTLLYKLGPFYSPLLFKTYSKLPMHEQKEWDVRYASMPFAVLCMWYAYVVLWDSDFFFRDEKHPNILRTHATTYTQLGMAMGYFIVDFIICIKYDMGGWPMHLHHAGSLMSVSAAVFTGQGHMHATWMLFTEATTPFVNMRWWLDKSDMKSSPLYFYNGVGLFVFWILARIVAFPPFFYVIYKQRDQIKYLSTYTKFLLYVFPIILTTLNLWWFTKILKGVLKMLSKPRTKRE
jgi:hypothetical protein